MTVNANYNFLRSAQLGDVLTAEAQESKHGRTLSFFDVRITNQDGTLLGTGIFTLLPPGSEDRDLSAANHAAKANCGEEKSGAHSTPLFLIS